MTSKKRRVVRYAIDCEFIDTPTCSHLLSLGIAAADGRDLYFEFDYPEAEMTPWLKQHVLPHLGQPHVTFEMAAQRIESFIGPEVPEFWCYYGAYGTSRAQRREVHHGGGETAWRVAPG
jgi:hypothetical protein